MKIQMIGMIGLLFAGSAFAATDPCTATFANIATALEAGNAAQAATYFQAGSRGQAAVKATTGLAAAQALAATFRGAQLLSTFNGGATYSSTWTDAQGKQQSLTIGAQTGLFGCVVQAW
jgi:hypothetical protein